MTLVVGHRGAPYAAPENTMAAFQAAVEMGVDAIELDVHVSADGELVVIHDADLARTTDRSGAVVELTAAEISSADAGFHHSPDGGVTYPFRGVALRVPLLTDVLAWLPAGIGLVVELKAVDAAEPTVEMLRARGVADRASVISFAREAIDRARARAPEIPTGLLLPPGADFGAGIEQVVAGGHLSLNPYEADLGTDPRPLVERAAAARKELGCYVIDDPERMRVVAAAGLAAFVTNRPDVARDALPPAGRPN